MLWELRALWSGIGAMGMLWEPRAVGWEDGDGCGRWGVSKPFLQAGGESRAAPARLGRC